MASRDSTAAIRAVRAAAYCIPTDAPESDGTFRWEATTLVIAEIEAGAERGIGYTYADAATARVIEDHFAPVLRGHDALATPARWEDMRNALRNLGACGIGAMALSAVDAALWDVKGKLLGVSLSVLLGQAHAGVPAYASGGFTSYGLDRLRDQVERWRSEGFTRMKMKVGRVPSEDEERIATARSAAGDGVELFVDANAAFERQQALRFAEHIAHFHVTWFEEPVASDDIAGLRLLRDASPAGMSISAGEYGYGLADFRRLLDAQAVDVLQADATRCGGITGFLRVAALCEAHHVPLSSHCAPSLHRPLCCAVRPAVHLEYFHDHARIEARFFDGAAVPVGGQISAELERPGLGIIFKEQDARCHRI